MGQPRLVRLPPRGPLREWELQTTQVLGYLRAVEGDSLRISHIGLDPGARGHGFASRLLQAALHHSGGRTVALTAAPFPSWREPGLNHTQLRAWYARHGFHPAPLRTEPYRMVRPALVAPAQPAT